MSNFTNTFGGSAVNPADVAYAAYTFSSLTPLYWPQFSAGQTNVAARFMSITTTAGGVAVTMPDCTLNSVGYDAIIYNAGSYSLSIETYSGSAIVTIAPGAAYYLMLTSNATQSGTWLTVQFGVGTGSAVASQLAGPGLLAYAGLLQVNLAATSVSSNFTITATGLGAFYVWTGGSGTITLPAASSVGNGFFFMFANNGSGSVTFSATGTIDGASTSVYTQTQSGFIFSNGTNWYSVGKGIQNTFSVTLLNLNVAGSSNVTETSAQAQNIIQNCTGVLTGNISVIVPAVVQMYIVSNNTTGSYTLTVKTASGTGIAVSQGSTAILYCDGTNVNNAYTATVSGSLVLSDGSYASPTLSFTSQPGTGLYSAGSNTFSAAANAAQVMQWAAQGSAVNYFGAVATAAGVAPTLGVSGTDMNINLSLVPKGSGYVTCGYLDSTVIGANVPSPASFTTLSASSTISGSGFSTYLASPPAIGGTTAAAITGTTITASTQFSGPGTGLTGTASGLNIGGNATTATTVTGSIGSAATGTTQTTGNSSTLIATTAFVNGTALTLAAGTTAVTQTVGDNSTKAATTAYVDGNSIGGINQSWQDVTASRTLGSTYTNSTGRPIQVLFTFTSPPSSYSIYNLGVAGTTFGRVEAITGTVTNCTSFIVPSGSTYYVSLYSGNPASSYQWSELR